VTPDQLSPEQRAAFDAIMGLAQRVAMHITTMPKEEWADAIKIARNTMEEAALEAGITDKGFVDLCAQGVQVMVSELENSGSPRGWTGLNSLLIDIGQKQDDEFSHSEAIRPLVELGLKVKK
jgi:hypothetical protein